VTRRTLSLLVAAIAIVVLVLVGPILLLLFQGTEPEAAASPSASASAAEPDRPAGPLEPGDVAWVFAPWAFAAGPANHYVLQAGTLAESEPVVDLEVPWVNDQATQVGRLPAVGRAIDGTVVYVADDGASSTIHRIKIAPNGKDEVLAEVPEIVWSMAVAPDGRHAYLALVDREDDQVDLGVVRLALDGSGETREVMAPAVAHAPDPDGIRLVAIARFGVDLLMSADGRHLVRRTCLGGPCTIDALDLKRGEQIALGPREMLSAGGGVLLSSRCEEVRCFTEVIDLATGRAQELPVEAEATLALVDGRGTVVFAETTAEGSALRAWDPFEGRAWDVLRMPKGSAVTLGTPQGDLFVSMPDGYLAAAIATDLEGKPGGGAVIEFQGVAVPLDGGAPIELPPVPLRHPDGFGVQG
jgi:hypothetical protein